MRHRIGRGGRNATGNGRWKSVLVTAVLVAGGVPGLAFAGAGPARADTEQPPSAGAHRAAAPQPADPKAPPGSPMATRDDADGLTAAQRTALRAAHAKATASGAPVTVDALTTGYSTTTADPSGTTTYTSSLLPTRVRKHGKWTHVDATLMRNADGTYSPAAATGALELSGGGTAPLAVMGGPQQKLALGWPTALPTPSAAGPTLTYPDVLPDVDLKVTATTLGGFSDVLVVKSAAAAADPRLRKLALHTAGTGLSVRSDRAGGLEAVAADGRVAYSGPQPIMWDSARKAGVPQGVAVPMNQQATSADPAAGTTPQPGAHTAAVDARLVRGTLSVTPNASALTRAGTVYPLTVQAGPSWNPHPESGSRQHFNEVQQACPTTTNYDSTAYGNPGVGDNTYSGCVGVERSYFQLSFPSDVWDSHIVSAVINTKETYAAQCSTTSTINMYLTYAVTKFTWNTKPAAGSFIGSHSFAPACSSYVSGGFAATAVAARAAKGHWTALAYVLINSSESNGDHFKRFDPNPTISITYNHVPNPASSLGVKLNSTRYGCAITQPYPILGKTVATTTPQLDAVVSDPDRDALQATYTYWSGSNPKATVKSADVSSGQHAPASFPSAYIQSLADGTVVNWQVSVSDGEDSSGNDPNQPQMLCHFTVDQHAPAEPTVASVGDLYPDFNATGTPGAPAGTEGTFTATVDPGTTGNSATAFVFGLDDSPPTSGAPASQTVTATNNSATFKITPVAPGTHTLYVYAVDQAGNDSPPHPYTFTAVGHAPTTYPSLSAAFDNTSISDDASPGSGDMDGAGSSYSRQDLEAAGWMPGGKVTVDGADFSLPDFGSGAADNVMAANQTITMNGEHGNAVVFLAASSYGGSALKHNPSDHSSPYVPEGTSVSGTNCTFASKIYSDCSEASGSVQFGDGTSQPYYLAVPDWRTGPSALAAVNVPHRNTPSGQITLTHHIFAFAVPIRPGASVTSITLPDLAATARSLYVPGLHIYGMAVRDTTTAPGSTAWTRAWSAPTDTTYAFSGYGSFVDQTFRTAVTPSVTGNSVRVLVSNPAGKAPLVFDDATIGNHGSTWGTTAAPPVRMTFGGGSTSVTVPIGGQAYSDPVQIQTTAAQQLVVSLHLVNEVSYLPMGSLSSNAQTYISPRNSGDHTGESSNSAYGATGSVSTPNAVAFAGVDVVTSGPSRTVAILGEGVHNVSGSTAQAGIPRLTENVAGAFEASHQYGGPVGVISAAITNNRMAQDQGAGGPAALTRLDRDVLSVPGISSVVVFEGLNDLVSGTDDQQLTVAYGTLRDELSAWNIRTVFVTLTPCGGAAPCTASVEDNRDAVNQWMSEQEMENPPGITSADASGATGVDDPNSTTVPPLQDLSAGPAPLDFDTGDHINLTADGYTVVSQTLTGDLTLVLPTPAP